MKQSVIHWREVNMKARNRNLPDNATECLIMIPGKMLAKASFWTQNAVGRETKPYFLTGNDYIKPVTGMLWVPAKEVLLSMVTDNKKATMPASIAADPQKNGDNR